MKDLGIVLFATERLILRRITMDDVDAIYSVQQEDS